MPIEPSPARFVVLFAVDPANDRPAVRLALMQRFLGSGLGADVVVLDQAFFPNYARVGFLLLVEAGSRDAVAAALEPCAGVFTTTVAEPASLSFDAAAGAATYAVFGVPTPHDEPAPTTMATPADTGVLRVRLHAQLPGGSPVASVTLLNAPTFGAAESFGRSAIGSAVTEAAHIQPMGDYIAAMRATTARDATLPAVAVRAPGAVLAAAGDASGTFTVTALDYPLILLSSRDLMPFTESMPLQVAPHGTPITVSGRTYVWQRLHSGFPVVVDWSNANNLWIHSSAQLSGDYNWSSPLAVLPDAPGLDYVIGTSSDHRGAHLRTDLGTWLGDLMTSDTYDAAWPEDTYTGGHLAAYQFIVGKLPGQTPPKRGTIKEPEEIAVLTYPGGTAFTSDEFQDVKDHLLVEIGHFTTADQWFGPNGIINAVNTQISVLSAGDLTVAASMMSIPPTTNVTMSLDDIFGIITAWVGEIPVIGGVIAAVIDTGYAVTKAVMPQEARQPIQATVAAIADQLDEYLISMVRSAALQQVKVCTDWGRLSEFSAGVATGRISAGAFYGAGGPGGGAGASRVDTTDADPSPALRSADSPPPLPPDYLHAAKNAWLTYVYQQLFTTQHAVACQISLTDQPPTNPWDPQNGNYHFTWSLPCAYQDSKGNDHEHGYLVYDCSTDAPAQVMAQLFNQGSALNVNPIEFFGGFNGWPQVVLHYSQGYQGISNTVPYPPITRLGLDSWGTLPG
jgi:hypothetical protein